MSSEAEGRYARLSAEPLASVNATATASYRGVPAAWRDVFAHRQLLYLLVRRDIKSRYKDSFLGMIWTLINPLVQLFMYYIVMGKFLGAAKGIPDFAIYVFAGLTIFGLFSGTLSSATSSVISNSGLVKKVYVPREVFPLAAAGSTLFTFLIQMVVLIIAAAALGTLVFSGRSAYFFVSILLVMIYGVAFGLLLSALNVYLRDVQYLTDVLLMLAMWASPIVYSWSMVHTVFNEFHFPSWAMDVYSNNPITLAVLGFHKAFWASGTSADYPTELALRMAIAMAIGLVLVWLCHIVFRRLQGNFAQEL